MKRSLFLFVLMLFVMASCTVPTPTWPAPPAAGTPSVYAFTATMQPTATARPSRAAALSPTARPTNTIAPTLTAAPTIDQTGTAIVERLVATVTPGVDAWASPDGRWQARLLTYDCAAAGAPDGGENAYDLLEIVEPASGITHIAASQLQHCGGLGAYGLGGIAWSPNSRFFYFTTAAFGSPDGLSLGWQRPIARFDTQAGVVEDLTGVLSPDQQKIAAVLYQRDRPCMPEAVVVQTLDGEPLARYPVNSEQQECDPATGWFAAGYQWWAAFAWAASSQALAYLENSCPADECQSSLYLVDLAAGQRQQLLFDRQPAFLAFAWSAPDRLTLFDEQYQTWTYTFSTGVLEAAP